VAGEDGIYSFVGKWEFHSIVARVVEIYTDRSRSNGGTAAICPPNPISSTTEPERYFFMNPAATFDLFKFFASPWATQSSNVFASAFSSFSFM
jgi:hypothetical protein